jgi:4Fe-4S ferredoxin
MTTPAVSDAAKAQDVCHEMAAKVMPVINPNRCEAKAHCVAVCPYNVFEIRALTPKELGVLTFATRIKIRIHGGKQAFVVRGDACHACGLCVTACPEKAITLAKASDTPRTIHPLI